MLYNSKSVDDILTIITKIKTKYKDHVIILYSDDEKWCLENFSNLDNVMIHNNYTYDYENFISLSNCNMIYPNDLHSTFIQCAILLNRCIYEN